MRTDRCWQGLLTVLAVLAPLMAVTLPAKAQTPDQWVMIGKKVHGGFGTYIALGIRIGQDALKTLGAEPRQVTVSLTSGPKAPCHCLADGLIVGTSASPGQGTLKVSAEQAPADVIGEIVVRDRKTGRSVRYVVPASAGPNLFKWNKANDERGRYDVVMSAPATDLFTRGDIMEPATPPKK